MLVLHTLRQSKNTETQKAQKNFNRVIYKRVYKKVDWKGEESGLVVR
jgi:hypothetical protein